MADPLFESRTARLGLPLLYAGQIQKELFLNESLARIDGLLFCAIEGEANAPPANPGGGQAWLVGAAPTGPWTGQAGAIAIWQSGNWLFQAPRPGLRLLNRSTGQDIRFTTAWQSASRPPTPTGGTTVDAQARAALAALYDSLTIAGVLPAA
jgi:hypothetical protein